MRKVPPQLNCPDPRRYWVALPNPKAISRLEAEGSGIAHTMCVRGLGKRDGEGRNLVTCNRIESTGSWRNVTSRRKTTLELDLRERG